MRITTHRLQDFILHLRKAASVYNDTVYYNYNRIPLDGDKFNAVKFVVTFQAYALALDGNGGEVMQVFGEDCGVDFEDASQDHAGTERADVLRAALETYCGQAGWEALPGEMSE